MDKIKDTLSVEELINPYESARLPCYAGKKNMI